MGGGGGGTTTKDDRGWAHIITCQCLNSTLLVLKLNMHPGINPCPSENSRLEKKKRDVIVILPVLCFVIKRGGEGGGGDA